MKTVTAKRTEKSSAYAASIAGELLQRAGSLRKRGARRMSCKVSDVMAVAASCLTQAPDAGLTENENTRAIDKAAARFMAKKPKKLTDSEKRKIEADFKKAMKSL